VASPVTVAQFRAILPAFSDATKYPDVTVQFNLDLAADSLNPLYWGARLTYGIVYYAAHYLAANGAVVTDAQGNPVGTTASMQVQGLVTSRSVGGMSKSVDVNMGSTDGGGAFNTTQYGRQYLTLRESIVAGPIQF
jgi:hypothetical protein